MDSISVYVCLALELVGIEDQAHTSTNMAALDLGV